MKGTLLRGSLLVLALAAGSAAAVESVVVLGLFPDRAVVRIDGRQRLLRVGETSPEGVRLIRADSESAMLEVDGRRVTHGLGADVSTRLSPPVERTVQVARDARGMYRTVGSINGLTVDFVVDTGATQVAMSAPQARRLGIDYRVVGTEGAVATASGMARAWYVMLDRVAVGAIELPNVEAVVIDANQPRTVLLGMSFLRRIRLEDRGSVLMLRQVR